MTHSTHKLSFPIRWAALAGALAFACVLPAQTPAWFPLETGNTWLYRPMPNSSTRPGLTDYRSIQVHGIQAVSGHNYFKVNYFGQEVLLRVEPSDGSVIVYNPTAGIEQPWVSPGLPTGSTFPTQINPCPTTGEIGLRNATVPTPAKDFENAVEVKFQGNCVDVGVTRQFYVPNVGLVSSEETTIAGPVQYALVYYRIGSTTAGAPEVSFSLAIDSPQYSSGASLQARLTLRSTSPDPIVLHFPSGQSFDFKIRNDKGDFGYTWSANRVFPLIVRDEKFGPGEKTYGLTVPLEGLPAGHYTAEAYLTTNPIQYLGQVGFDILP